MFKDALRAEEPDPWPTEERWRVTGLVRDLLLAVVYTEREDDEGTIRKRIISARRANRNEQDTYYTQGS